MSPTLASKINEFNSCLEFDGKLPKGIEVMNPFRDKDVRDLSSEFYEKFYSDNQPRQLILGINPGRFGAGVTGIPFTDPVKLDEECGLPNPFPKKTEPSAGFIYHMIGEYGGVEDFYTDFLIMAVSPLGFTKDGLNYNYYDSKDLLKATKPFIFSSLKKMMEWDVDRSVCFCLGNAKNFKFLEAINKASEFFTKIVPLPHPRWIVQYRRKRMGEFVKMYLEAFKHYR